MAVARRSPRTRPVVVVLLLLSLTLVVIDQSGDDSPAGSVRSLLRDTFAAVGGAADRVWPFGDGSAPSALEAENARLRAELESANGRLAQVADAERERKQLNELFALPSPDGTQKVIANVVSIGASNFDATIELGKGSDDGIATGMPVVNGMGLIGRVVQTSASRSIVLLVSDTTSNVSIRYSEAGDVGVAAGEGMTKSLRGDLVNLESAVKIDEIAVTSGLDGSLFPPGIPVAKVTATDAGPQDLRRKVTLEPVVDFEKLDDVAVLKWRR